MVRGKSGAPRIRSGFSGAAWDLAFREVRVEIRYDSTGRYRAHLWVNALLNDSQEEGPGADAAQANVTSFSLARIGLTRRLVDLIDKRHRAWMRYPLLSALAKSEGRRPEVLAEAYLRFLRRDLGSAREPRTGSERIVGSLVALRVVEGHSEGS